MQFWSLAWTHFFPIGRFPARKFQKTNILWEKMPHGKNRLLKLLVSKKTLKTLLSVVCSIQSVLHYRSVTIRSIEGREAKVFRVSVSDWKHFRLRLVELIKLWIFVSRGRCLWPFCLVLFFTCAYFSTKYTLKILFWFNWLFILLFF